VHKALSTVLVHTICNALTTQRPSYKRYLVVCLSDCTLLGLSVQAAHVDLLLELLHTASVAHAGHIHGHDEAHSTPTPVFALSSMRIVIDAHSRVQCAGKHVACDRSDSWVTVCAESDAAEPRAIAANFGCGPEGLYRLCHLWSVLILFLHADFQSDVLGWAGPGFARLRVLCYAVLCRAVHELPCPTKQAAVCDLM